MENGNTMSNLEVSHVGSNGMDELCHVVASLLG